MLIYHFSILLSLGFIFSCSSQQTSTASGQSEKDVKQTTNVAEAAVTTLIIADGSAEGAAISVPPQSLPSGATLSLDRVDAPQGFSDVGIDMANIASSAIAIEATDGNGEPISDLASPMTVSIPYTSTGLAAVERIDKNLCVLLEDADSKLYVWHANSISIVTAEKLAKFTTKKLGIYQLFFCGPETPASFTEATTAKVASTPPSSDSATANGSSTFGAQTTFSLAMSATDYGFSGKFCLFASYTPNNADLSPKVLAGIEYPITATSLDLGFNTYEIPDDATPYIHLLVQTKDQTCSLIISSNLTMPEYFQAFRFKVSKAGLSDGSESGQFGSKTFATVKVALKATAPNGEITQMSPMPAKTLCITGVSKVGSSEVGTTTINTAVDTSGKINALSSLPIVIPTGGNSSTTQSLEVKVGENCMTDTSTYNTLSEPYRIKALTPISNVYYMMAVSMSTASDYGNGNFCAELYNGAYVSNSIPAVGSATERLGQWQLDPKAKYKVYIPFDNTDMDDDRDLPIYDMRFVLGSCSENNDSDFSPISNDKVLTNNFQL